MNQVEVETVCEKGDVAIKHVLGPESDKSEIILGQCEGPEVSSQLFAQDNQKKNAKMRFFLGFFIVILKQKASSV